MSRLPVELENEIINNYVTTDVVMTISGIGRSGVYRYITNGTLPAIKVEDGNPRGWKYLIHKDDAYSFLKERFKLTDEHLNMLGKEVSKIKTFKNGKLTSTSASFPVCPKKARAVSRSSKTTFIDRVKRYINTLLFALMGKI